MKLGMPDVVYHGPDPWVMSVKVVINDKELVNFETKETLDKTGIEFHVLKEELDRLGITLTPNTMVYIYVGEKIFRAAAGSITEVDDLIGFSIDLTNIQVRQPDWMPEDDIDLTEELIDEGTD